MNIFNPFFKDKNLQALKTYKYQAIDKSILGKYFYQDYIVTPVLKSLDEIILIHS